MNLLLWTTSCKSQGHVVGSQRGQRGRRLQQATESRNDDIQRQAEMRTTTTHYPTHLIKLLHKNRRVLNLFTSLLYILQYCRSSHSSSQPTSRVSEMASDSQHNPNPLRFAFANAVARALSSQLRCQSSDSEPDSDQGRQDQDRHQDQEADHFSDVPRWVDEQCLDSQSMLMEMKRRT